MRALLQWLFGILMLINLAVFLWGYQGHGSDPDRQPLPPLPKGVAEVRLLSELNANGIAALRISGTTDPVTASQQEVVMSAPDRVEQTVAPALEVADGEATDPEVESRAEPRTEDRNGAGTEPGTELLVPIASGDSEEKGPGSAGVPAPAQPIARDAQSSEMSVRPGLTTAAPAVVGDVTRKQCWTWGPFESEEAAREQIPGSHAQGFAVKLRTTTRSERTGFWVMIPPQPDAAGSKRRLDELRDAGISDVWRFSKGEMENAISLGLFDRRARAQIRLEDLAAAGVTAEIHPRIVATSDYWVDLSTTTDASALTALEPLLEKASGTSLRPVDCQAIATPSPIE